MNFESRYGGRPADGRADRSDREPDRRTGTPANGSGKGLWTIPKLMKRYGIGKDPLYNRMAYQKSTPGIWATAFIWTMSR